MGEGLQADGWNLATMWEAVADEVGHADATIHAGVTHSWGTFEDRSARLASVFAAHGVGHDAKVAHLLYNGTEYLETTFASFKQRAVPVNVNYRYTETELQSLLENADAEALVVSSELAERLDAVRSRLPLLRLVVQVGDGPLIDGALRYEDAVRSADPAPRIDRSPADLWFLYTGGTTGLPKGVMWPHRSLYGTTAATFKGAREALPSSPKELAAAVRRIHDTGSAPRLLPAAPLMHGTSAISSWGALTAGGCVATLTGRTFEPVELLDTVERHRLTNVVIVGDAFARPIVSVLDEAAAQGRGWDLSSVRLIVSSGVMWSEPVKEALLRHVDAALADLLGSSEAVGFANSVAKRGRAARTARFRLGPDAAVFTEDGRRVEPGSGEVGVLAVGGPIPIGYYKDPEKSAATFREVDGRVWSTPGDFATVEEDGTITLLGRGSVCINTAGEKVFPEEVEEVLKQHPSVEDANVVGVPDEKWGQAVTAVVSTAPGARVDEAALIDHCRETLAGYKCPKRIVVVEQVRRGPNGKADYRWASEVAAGA